MNKLTCKALTAASVVLFTIAPDSNAQQSTEQQNSVTYPKLIETAKQLGCKAELVAVAKSEMMVSPADYPLFNFNFKNIDHRGLPETALDLIVMEPFGRINAAQTKDQLDAALRNLKRVLATSAQSSGYAPNASQQMRQFESKALAFHQCVVNAQFSNINIATYGEKAARIQPARAEPPSWALTTAAGDTTYSCNLAWSSDTPSNIKYPSGFEDGAIFLLFSSAGAPGGGGDRLGKSFVRSGANLERVNLQGEFRYAADPVSNVMLFSKAIMLGRRPELNVFDSDFDPPSTQSRWRAVLTDLSGSDNTQSVYKDFPSHLDNDHVLGWNLTETPGLRKGQVEAKLSVGMLYRVYGTSTLSVDRPTPLLCLVRGDQPS